MIEHQEQSLLINEFILNIHFLMVVPVSKLMTAQWLKYLWRKSAGSFSWGILAEEWPQWQDQRWRTVPTCVCIWIGPLNSMTAAGMWDFYSCCTIREKLIRRILCGNVRSSFNTMPSRTLLVNVSLLGFGVPPLIVALSFGVHFLPGLDLAGPHSCVCVSWTPWPRPRC